MGEEEHSENVEVVERLQNKKEEQNSAQKAWKENVLNGFHDLNRMMVQTVESP